MSFIQQLIAKLNRHDIPQADIDRVEQDLAVALTKTAFEDDHQKGRLLSMLEWDLYVYIPPKDWSIIKIELTLLPKHNTFCCINELFDGEILSRRSIGPTVKTSDDRSTWAEKYNVYLVPRT